MHVLSILVAVHIQLANLVLLVSFICFVSDSRFEQSMSILFRRDVVRRILMNIDLSFFYLVLVEFRSGCKAHIEFVIDS